MKGFDDNLLQTLGKCLFPASDGGVVRNTEVPGFTSVQIDNITYNAHPFFKNDHTWKDWVYIKWDGYPEPIPARIDMFFDLTECEISNRNMSESMNEEEHNRETRENRGFLHVYPKQEIYAVIWSAKSLTLTDDKETDYHLPLNLGYRVELEEFRRIIPVSAFFKPCFGMLNMCGLPGEFDNTAFVLKDRSKWADFFLDSEEE